MRSLVASLRRACRTLLPYAAAVCAPWLLCIAETHTPVQAPMFILFFAVVVSARLGGLLPGLLCALFSCAFGSYYFFTPAFTWDLDASSATEVMLFGAASVTVVFIQHTLQKKTLELKSALAMRDEFLAVAGHELNNPLAALHLRTQTERRKLAKRGETDVATFAQYLDLQIHGIERLRTLIDELLDMSRIRAGRLHLHPESVDLTGLVRDVVTRFSDQAQSAGCGVTIEAPPAPVLGMWDRMRIEQVVTNLLSNALKYGAGKPVTVAVRATATQAWVQIVDHGCGIATADQARIFARFERCNAPNSVKGLGLGLWIVQQIIQACGGKIAVRSEAGAGSTFEVCLPRRTASI